MQFFVGKSQKQITECLIIEVLVYYIELEVLIIEVLVYYIELEVIS